MKKADRSLLLLQSAIRILGGKEVPMKSPARGIDTPIPEALKSGSGHSKSGLGLPNVPYINQPKEPIMAKAKKNVIKEAPGAVAAMTATTTNEASTETNDVSTLKPGETVTHADGSTETLNPVPVKEKTKQELAQEAAQAKIAAKAEKAKAAAEKKEAAEKAKAERLAAIAANKSARIDRLTAMTEGTKRTYTGSMLALADRLKNGAYVKSGTGQLRSDDELARALDLVPVDNVITLGKLSLELEANPYTALNSGQQSMNFRNRMRGAIKKGTLTIAKIQELIAEHGLDTYKGHAERVAAEKAAKAAAKAKAAAEKQAKAEAAAKAAVKTEPEAEAATA